MKENGVEKPECKDDDSTAKTGQFLRPMLISGVIIMFYIAGNAAYRPLLDQFVRKRISETYFNNSNATEDTGSVCTRNRSDENVQLDIKVQQTSADILLYLSISTSLIGIFINFLIGSYSDFLGRKFLFFVPTLGAALKSLVLCLTAAFELPINWLYLGSVLEGLTGGIVAFIMAVFSYTADVTPPSKSRTFIIAIMDGVLAVSGSLGSIAVGFIIQNANFMFAALAITIVYTVDIALLLFILPQTLNRKTERKWSPILHAKKVLAFFYSGTQEKRTLYILGMLIFYFAFVVDAGRSSVETLYQLDKPFCWSSVRIGYYGAARYTFGVLCSVAALKLLQHCFHDMTIGLIGHVFGMVAFIVEGLAVNDWMLYAVPAISFISFILVPVTRAIMSQMTSPLQQGAMFSSLAAMETFCSLTSTAIYNAVYRQTVGTLRGTVFLLMAGIGIITATLVIIFLRLTKEGLPKHEVTVPAPRVDEEITIKQTGVNNIKLQNIAK